MKYYWALPPQAQTEAKNHGSDDSTFKVATFSGSQVEVLRSAFLSWRSLVKRLSPRRAGKSRRWRGERACAGVVGVRGTRHLLNLPEGYRTRTSGARSGQEGRRMGGQGAPENLARSGDARLRRWRSSPRTGRVAEREQEVVRSPGIPLTTNGR